MTVLVFSRYRRHAPAPAEIDADSGGYKSGRSSCRGTPETRSTPKTRSGGTSSHCDTACLVMPREAASLTGPPAFLMARESASFMGPMSSTASRQSQGSLHLQGQALLYHCAMTLGERIKRARKARGLSLDKLGHKMGVSRQLVWQWERGESDPSKHIGELCKVLEVPYAELYGEPSPQSPLVVKLDHLHPTELSTVEALVDTLLARHAEAEKTKRPKRSVK